MAVGVRPGLGVRGTRRPRADDADEASRHLGLVHNEVGVEEAAVIAGGERIACQPEHEGGGGGSRGAAHAILRQGPMAARHGSHRQVRPEGRGI